MKRIQQFILVIASCLFLAACDNSLARADRTVGLIQEDITEILNDLSDIQNTETALQGNFETVLSTNDLQKFNDPENDVQKNIMHRKSQIDDINKHRKNLAEMLKELTPLVTHEQLPGEQMQQIIQFIQNLEAELSVYVTDYEANLELESNSFKAIANPDYDYKAFFQAQKNINTLAETNLMNLDRLLPHFEPLRAALTNLKVDLVKRIENSK